MFDPWVGKIPWYPGKSHRQRSLAGYSPWGHKELDAAEHTHTHTQKTTHLKSLNLAPLLEGEDARVWAHGNHSCAPRLS